MVIIHCIHAVGSLYCIDELGRSWPDCKMNSLPKSDKLKYLNIFQSILRILIMTLAEDKPEISFRENLI